MKKYRKGINRVSCHTHYLLHILSKTRATIASPTKQVMATTCISSGKYRPDKKFLKGKSRLMG